MRVVIQYYMFLYTYLDYKKNQVVCEVEATSILEADVHIKALGHSPFNLSCRIGVTLILFNECRTADLYQGRLCKTKYYQNDEIVLTGNTRKSLVKEHSRLIKQFQFNPAKRLFWELPLGDRVWIKTSELQDLQS